MKETIEPQETPIGSCGNGHTYELPKSWTQVPACPTCSSKTVHVEIKFNLSVKVAVAEVKMQGIKQGATRPFLIYENKTKWNYDRGQEETRQMNINREEKTYLQEWRDKEGKVTFRKEGRLGDPNIHGESAHRKK